MPIVWRRAMMSLVDGENRAAAHTLKLCLMNLL
jgi:hypothetical protein